MFLLVLFSLHEEDVTDDSQRTYQIYRRHKALMKGSIVKSILRMLFPLVIKIQNTYDIQCREIGFKITKRKWNIKLPLFLPFLSIFPKKQC